VDQSEQKGEDALMGLLIFIAIPTAIYFAIVALVRAESSGRRARDRMQRIQRAEEAKQLKW